ncbi:MAG: FemAB family system-associated protein [Frankiales bacterium]|nr:FemAB family system-associated protein [Frankiales bacterium]
MMPIRRSGLVLRPAPDSGTWDEFVTGHPAATPFHLSQFLSTAGRLLGLDVHLTLAEADGVVVGAVPLLIRAQGPFAQVNHNLPFPYLGPLVGPDVSLSAVVDAVRRYLKPRSVLQMGMQFGQPVALPSGAGWSQEDDYTSAYVTLAGLDDDDILARFSRAQRSSYRRGLRNGVVTSVATREDLAGQLSRWSTEVLARQGLPPRWPVDAQLELHEQLASLGASSATAVHLDGELVGVAISLLLNGRSVGWEMGMSDAGRNAGAAPVLHVETMRQVRDLGAVELDLLGAPTEGIARYKASLGAQFRSRSVLTWSAPLVPWARRLSRAAGALPVGASR